MRKALQALRNHEWLACQKPNPCTATDALSDRIRIEPLEFTCAAMRIVKGAFRSTTCIGFLKAIEKAALMPDTSPRRMFLQVVVLLLVPYVPPLLMPTWRWLFAYVIAAVILLTIWFHGVMKQPTRTGLEAIGALLFMCVAISTAAGTLVRTITLIVKRRSALVAINVLGAILPFETIAVFVWANK